MLLARARKAVAIRQVLKWHPVSLLYVYFELMNVAVWKAVSTGIVGIGSPPSKSA